MVHAGLVHEAACRPVCTAGRFPLGRALVFENLLKRCLAIGASLCDAQFGARWAERRMHNALLGMSPKEASCYPCARREKVQKILLHIHRWQVERGAYPEE